MFPIPPLLHFPCSLCISPPQQMMAATNSARSLSSSSKALNLMANWNFGSIMSLKGLRRLFRNSRVMKPPPWATSSPSLFMQEASRAKSASYTPYFSRVTWSLRSRVAKPGTALANSVTSVTVATEAYWQNRKSRASTSLSRTVDTSPDATLPSSWVSSFCSACWRVSMSWMTKGFHKGWREKQSENRCAFRPCNSKCAEQLVQLMLTVFFISNWHPV